MTDLAGLFSVVCKWCSKRRGILPTGVLICPRCDRVAEGDHGFPNERLVKDVDPKP